MSRYKTYLKFLERNRLFAFINIMGLGLSLAFVILVGNLVYRNLTTDDDLEGKDNFYFLAGIQDGNESKYMAMHYNMGDRIQSQVAAVKDWCAFFKGIGQNPYLKYNGINYTVSGLAVKKNFFQMFHFPLLEGNRKDVLSDPKSVVLTERGARKIFGTTVGVVGKMVNPGFAPNETFRITGVMADFENSLFPDDVDVLVPFENVDVISWPNGIRATQMNGYGMVTLVFEMQGGFNPESDTQMLTQYLKKEYAPYLQNNLKTQWFAYSKMNLTKDVQIPVFEIYSGTLLLVYVFIGALVLLLAVLNYISMSVAQTSYRAKEMATRRLMGASQTSIFWRMIGEAFMMTLLAFLVGILLALACEDFASELFGMQLDVWASLYHLPIVIYVLLLLLISFLSGLFPALLLSHYHPLDVVKGTFRRKTKMIYLRVLYILQGGICMGLLGSVFYISFSFSDAMNRPVGYRTDNLIVYSTAGDKKAALAFIEKAERNPYVKEVALCASIPIDWGWNNTNDFRMEDSIAYRVSVEIFDVDAHFTSVFGINVQNDTHPTWDNDTYYVCSSMNRDLFGTNKDEIISEQEWKVKKAGVYPDFRQGLPFLNDRYTIIQVIKREELAANYMVVHTVSENAEVKERIDALYQSIYHMNSLDSNWYNDLFEQYIRPFQRTIHLLDVFTLTSVVIAMLGLMAFSIYYVGQRRRDMAIRKVFGSDNRTEMLNVLRYTVLSLCLGGIVSMLFVIVPLLWFELLSGGSFNFIRPYWTYLLSFFLIIGLSVCIVWMVTWKIINESPIKYLKSE